MLLLQRLLLLPLLTPLFVVVLVGAINPRPVVALRLLTWTSPALSIGLWLSIAAGSGAAISAGATGLALRLGPGARGLPTGRQTNRDEERHSRRQSSRPTSQAPEPHDDIWPESNSRSKGPSKTPFQAGPSRTPGDPAPTVAVPFRVIRKAPTTQASAPPPHTPEAKATAVGDGWDQASSDDW